MRTLLFHQLVNLKVCVKLIFKIMYYLEYPCIYLSRSNTTKTAEFSSERTKTVDDRLSPLIEQTFYTEEEKNIAQIKIEKFPFHSHYQT